MANTYKHGTYGVYGESIGATPVKSKTVAVYVGTAPVNLVSGYADLGLVNKPILVNDYASAVANLGYSDDWDTFTLCEAIKAHFNNPLGNAGSVVFINVLDPDVHRSEEAVTANLTFTNGRATLESDKIILDTLTLNGKTRGVDYDVQYSHTSGKLTIVSIGNTKISGSVSATYYEIDTAAIDETTIIGEATENGVYTGLGVCDLIYQAHNVIPSLIVAPSWSEIPEVYEAMLTKASKLNGHWDAFVYADIPILDGSTKVDTIALAKKWQTDNGYTNGNSKVFYPQIETTAGDIYHLSTLAAWRTMLTDNANDGIPMESPSNKPIPAAKQYFGADSTNVGFDQERGNGLNEVGITTAVYWGGKWVLWGSHTAAYKYGNTADAKYIFDNSVRMMMYVLNNYQVEHAATIDKPMTRALAETIKNREQQKADALAAVGAFIGKPVVEFRESENSTADLVDGNFVWSFEGTPTPPFKSGTLSAAYTDAGFVSFYEEV